FRLRQDDGLVRSSAGLQAAAGELDRPELTIGNQIVGVAGVLQRLSVGLSQRALYAAAVMRQPATGGRGRLRPVVVDRVIKQHVVIRLAGLQERLAALDVAVQRREVVPE